MTTDLKTLQKKLLKVKKELKEWEFVFQRKHHRPPTVKDISDRPNVEKYYRKYNQLKKDYKLAAEAETELNNPVASNTATTTTTTSVEFVKSSTFAASYSKSKKQQEEQQQYDSNMTEEEAFWLGNSRSHGNTNDDESTNNLIKVTSMSQPTERKIKSPEPERLILGGSQPIQKKNVVLEQKLFGHLMLQNPRNRKPPAMTTIVEQKKQEEEEEGIAALEAEDTNNLNTQDISYLFNHEDSEDDDMEDVQIINREPDHLRHYNMNQLPCSIVGPGFFNSSKICDAYILPLFTDDEEKRRQRILAKLEKGTLGEALEENKKLEDEMDDDVKEFILNNTRNNHDFMQDVEETSSQSTTASSSQQYQQQHQHQQQHQQQQQQQQQQHYKPYKKKPIQRRQTRLYKLKFVETR